MVALGITTILSYGTNQYLFGLLVEPVSRELGWDKASIGLAYSGVVLVSGIAGLGLGHALDRFGARVLLAAGSLITGAALLLLARVHTLAAFDLLWTFGIGAGSALTFYPVTMTVVANWFDRRRLRAFSLLTFMGAFSSTLTYPVAGLLIARLGWRDAVAILGGVQLLVALPLHALVVRRHPEDHGLHPDGAATPGTSTPESGVPFDAAMRSAAFWLPTTAIALSLFREHRDAARARRVSDRARVLAVVRSRARRPVRARVLAGALVHRVAPASACRSRRCFPRRSRSRPSGSRCSRCAPSLWGVIAYVCTFGAAYGATFPLRGALMAQRFGRRSYGAILAAQGVPVGVVSALGPVVAGRLIDALGYGAAFESCIAALVAAAVVVAIPVPAPRGLAGSATYREPYTPVT